MKINQRLTSVLVGALVVLANLAACSSDDSTSSAPASRVSVRYSATVSAQLLDVANVLIRYIGDNGQVVSEQMSEPTWTKSVLLALPAKAGMSLQPTLKGPVAEGEYAISAMGVMDYDWLDADGQPLRAGLAEATPVMTGVFYADGVASYLNTIATSCQVARAFSSDYSVADVTINWGANTAAGSTQNTGISKEGATGDNR